MRRLLSIASAFALLAMGAGCLGVTGVGDYTVSDQSGADDSHCKTAGTTNDCIQCCARNHVDEATPFLQAFYDCACTDPGFCSGGECIDYCAGGPQSSSTAPSCSSCINTHISGTTCPKLNDFAYYRCASAC